MNMCLVFVFEERWHEHHSRPLTRYCKYRVAAEFELVTACLLNISLCKVGVPFLSDVSLDIVNETSVGGGLLYDNIPHNNQSDLLYLDVHHSKRLRLLYIS